MAEIDASDRCHHGVKYDAVCDRCDQEMDSDPDYEEAAPGLQEAFRD